MYWYTTACVPPSSPESIFESWYVYVYFCIDLLSFNRKLGSCIYVSLLPLLALSLWWAFRKMLGKSCEIVTSYFSFQVEFWIPHGKFEQTRVVVIHV